MTPAERNVARVSVGVLDGIINLLAEYDPEETRTVGQTKRWFEDLRQEYIETYQLEDE